MSYAGPGAGSDVASYKLNWLSPEPGRTLTIEVNYQNNGVQWGWITSATTRRMTNIDPGTFGDRLLDQLIRGLADQSAWSKGQPPLIRP